MKTLKDSVVGVLSIAIIAMLASGCLLGPRRRIARESAAETSAVLVNYRDGTVNLVQRQQEEQAKKVEDLLTQETELASLRYQQARQEDTMNLAAEILFDDDIVRTDKLAAFLKKQAQDQIDALEASDRFARARRNELIGELDRAEIDQKDLKLVQSKLAYLSSRDPLLLQILSYVVFAEQVNSQMSAVRANPE